MQTRRRGSRPRGSHHPRADLNAEVRAQIRGAAKGGGSGRSWRLEERTRAFEHGEILAYVRLLLSYVNPPSAASPAIREVRYNFVQSSNPIKSHSIRFLACSLIKASGQAPLPDLSERFRGRE